MTRASWECPITGEQCSSPHCSRTYCANKRAKAVDAQVEQMLTGKLARRLAKAKLSEQEWDEALNFILEERKRKKALAAAEKSQKPEE
jgi:hypothetical protein